MEPNFPAPYSGDEMEYAQKHNVTLEEAKKALRAQREMDGREERMRISTSRHPGLP
jgi:hypothetical protein